MTTKHMFFFFLLFSLSLSSCPLLLPAMSPFANLGHHADTTIGIPRGLAAELFRGGAVQQLTVRSTSFCRFASEVKVKKTSQNSLRKNHRTAPANT